MNAIDIKNVSYRFPEGTRALNDVDFYVQVGEFVAMLASNGGGKTTLLKVITALLKPQSGSVHILGNDINTLSSEKLYQRVGLVFQNPDDQLFCTTVTEDVSFGARNLNLPGDEVNKRTLTALGMVDALHLKDRAVHHLSFGEKKRVCVAGILAMKPDILILDEPTAGLDPQGEQKMLRLLKKLNSENKLTVVLATHSVDMLPLFADRIYVLKQGEILKCGSSLDIFTDDNMLDRAGLRLPYVSTLLDELKRYDGVPINGLPLTVGEARKHLLELIPDNLIVKL